MRGDGRVYKRGDIWWVEYWYRGRQYRESSQSDQEADARKLLRRRYKEIGADELGLRPFVGPQQDRVVMGGLLDALEADYRLREIRSWPQFQSHLRPIRAAFADRPAVDLTEEAVDRYISERLAAGRTPATVNRETQLLGQALRLAVRRHRLSRMPVIRHLSERENVRQGFFEHADFEAVVAALPDYLQDFARFAYLTGWRKREIGSLTWADVDRSGNLVHLRSEASKNREGRKVVLEGELAALIERHWLARLFTGRDGEVRVSDLVFHRDGTPIGEFRKAWASACKAAGLKGRLFHDLRRTAIRNMVRAGVHETVAMKISGHRTRSVFDRYNITSERDLREAAQKTEAYLAAQQTPPAGEERTRAS